jgi:hypothetical protein
MTLGGEQAARRGAEPLNGGALTFRRRSQRVPPGAPGEQLRLGSLQLITGVEQLGDFASLCPHELVYRPSRDRRLA